MLSANRVNLWKFASMFAPKTANTAATFDEERQDWNRGSCWTWPTKCLWLPRVRKATVGLLLIDVMLVGLLFHALEPLITLLRRNDDIFGSQAMPSRDRPPIAWNAQSQYTVPGILHQTCANDTIPEKWISSQRSCKEVYSDFEYKLWTDDVARDFLSSEYAWFIDMWDNYAFPIQRADAIRYFILYHYGGIYLDMDTVCNEQLPIQFEPNSSSHYALFKSTLPTGVTNDIMILSAGHPVFAVAVSKLPVFYSMTRFWARLQPYANIMMSTGPLFLSLAVKDYLLQQPSQSSPTVQVVDPSELTRYITDLESSTWHRADAKVLMWLGYRPWAWFSLGAIAVVVVLYLLNRAILLVGQAISHKVLSGGYSLKPVKLA